MDAVRAILSTTLPEDKFRFLEALLSHPDFSIRGAEQACGLSIGTGARWLARADVREVLGQLVRSRVKRHVDMRDKTVIALWSLATYDPRAAWDADGAQVHPKDLPDALAAAMTEAKPVLDNFGHIAGWAYKFADRSKVLLALLQHFEGVSKDTRADENTASTGTRTTILFRGVDGSAVEGSR